MSESQAIHVSQPQAPPNTFPFGANPVYTHPEVPPSCIPANTNDKNAMDVTDKIDASPTRPSYSIPASYYRPPPPQRMQQQQPQQLPTSSFPPPPKRESLIYHATDNPSDPAHYMRDPTKLIAYLIPFPVPNINTPYSDIPQRFMIYTPPPPPLHAPPSPSSPSSSTNPTTKEARMHKVQRKWQNEVRAAKQSTAKPTSWKGVKSKATKGINWAMNQTTSSNVEFLGRVSPTNSDPHSSPAQSDREHDPANTNSNGKTVPVSEMILVYPQTLNKTMTEPQIRAEFINTMLRTKSKAQRDAIIATGLMPVAFGVDVALTLVWPFGGLVEIDGLWGWSSFRGAKTARSITKRLGSSSSSAPSGGPGHTDGDGEDSGDKLKLSFVDSQRIEVLRRYLEASCHLVDSDIFPGYHTSPTETQVLEAIGWAPEHVGGETRNWEDEEWETSEVKEDVKLTFHKAAKEWKKYALLLERNPEKAKLK